VTLTVVDGEQMAVSDADVSYTISVEQEEEGETEATEATEAEETEETEGEVGNSVIAYGSEKTDSYGTVEVLSSARYQEGLVITAQTVEEN
jgi:fructosamine-3-kinase